MGWEEERCLNWETLLFSAKPYQTWSVTSIWPLSLSPLYRILIRMMYVRAWGPFLQPPVYSLLVWRCKMSAGAMTISLFKTLHRFVEQRHGADFRRNREEKRKRSKGMHVWGECLIEPRCCSCSIFFVSAVKTHSDPGNLEKEMCARANIQILLFLWQCVFVFDCLNRVRKPFKFTLKVFHWRIWNSVTQ